MAISDSLGLGSPSCTFACIQVLPCEGVRVCVAVDGYQLWSRFTTEAERSESEKVLRKGSRGRLSGSTTYTRCKELLPLRVLSKLQLEEDAEAKTRAPGVSASRLLVACLKPSETRVYVNRCCRYRLNCCCSKELHIFSLSYSSTPPEIRLQSSNSLLHLHLFWIGD